MTVVSELRRLLAEATDGPWHKSGSLAVYSSGESARCVDVCYRETDAALIVALRNHADALLDVVEEARRVIDVDHGVCHPDLLRALARLDGKETQ